MRIVRWDPFEAVGTLRRAMDRVLDEVLAAARRVRGADAGATWAPAVDLFETDGEVVVRALVPAIDPKTIDVSVARNTVTIRGGPGPGDEMEADRAYHVREIPSGAFARTLDLPTEVKGQDARATYKDGILSVAIPKSERVRPTTVKVQVA